MRSSVSVTTPFAPRFTVSATGRAGIAPGALSSASSTRSIDDLVDEGPCGVVNQDTRRARGLSRLSSPSRAESCRAAPPGTGGRDRDQPRPRRRGLDRPDDRPPVRGRSADALLAARPNAAAAHGRQGFDIAWVGRRRAGCHDRPPRRGQCSPTSGQASAGRSRVAGAVSPERAESCGRNIVAIIVRCDMICSNRGQMSFCIKNEHPDWFSRT